MPFKVLFFIIFLSSQVLSNNKNLEKITLQLSWFDQFQFAGYYIAKEKGFYKDVGLDVKIQSFDWGVNTAQGVSEGKYDFAIGRETLLLDRANGLDIVALYAIFQSSPLVLLSTKESGIDSIEDFKFKRVMTTIDDASEVSIKAMITSEKIDLTHLNFIPHTHNIKDLVEKNTDIISAYISKTPYDLQKMNIEYNVFAPRDYGFDMYSDFLITSSKFIDKKPATVEAFKKASLKGWKYAYENIEETVDLIKEKYDSQKIPKDSLIYEAKELKKLSFYNTSELGSINRAKIQRIHDLYNIMGILPRRVNLDTFLFEKESFYSKLSSKEKRFIDERPVLIAGISTNLEPFSFQSNIGLNSGIVQDYLALISEKTGLRIISHVDTKENLSRKLKTNEIDFLVSNHNLNKLHKHYSRPYFTLNEEHFKLKDTNVSTISSIGIFEPIKSEDRISKIETVYNDIKIVKYTRIDTLIKDLVKKKVDSVYAPSELIFSNIKKNQIHNIEFADSSLKTNKVFISMAVQNSNKILNDILTKSIKDISQDQHEAIRNKWVPIIIDKKTDWTLVWQISLGIGIFIIMLLYKQVSLRKINDKLSKQKGEIEVANKKLKELSELDHLTQLYNRRFFEESIEKVLSKNEKEDKKSSIVMLDIDDFKSINDNYGHKGGDEVLKILSDKLKSSTRKDDILARTGGEEFMILLPNTSFEEGQIYAENIRNSIENLKISLDNDLDISITVSIGLTTYDKNEGLSKMLIKVDNNLYEAKTDGKNRVIAK